MQEGKVVVWVDFTNSWGKKRSEREGKKERYNHLNAKFPRRARRNKKALNEHCKEIEEKNRMAKTRDPSKKTEDIKGTFHARKDMIKERNWKDLI